MTPTLSKIKNKVRRDGTQGLILSAISHGIKKGLETLPEPIPRVYQSNIRVHLPKRSYITRNGVKISRARIFDPYLPADWHTNPAGNKGYKVGNSTLVQKTVKKGDVVVVIGGGYGVTAVYAAECVGPDGHVHIYEASKKQVEIIREALSLHNVSDRCTVNHAIVGDDFQVYDGRGDPRSIKAGSLPSCDLLEMDCEGAELNILQDLLIRPQRLIVEIHPHHHEGDPEGVINTLSNLGYDIEHRVDQYGKNLTESELFDLLHFQRNGTNTTDWGAVHPPIVSAKAEI